MFCLLYTTSYFFSHVLRLAWSLVSGVYLALSFIYFVLSFICYVLLYFLYAMFCFVLYVTSYLVLYAISCFVFCATSHLILFIATELEAMALFTQKHYCSKSLVTPTLSKRRVATTSFIVSPPWKKLANNAIFCILIRSSRPISSSFYPIIINYLLLN